MNDKKFDTSEVHQYTVIKKISCLLIDYFTNSSNEDSLNQLMVSIFYSDCKKRHK